MAYHCAQGVPRPSGEPLLLFVQGYDAHGPYSPPLGFGELYDPDYSGLVQEPRFLTLQVQQRTGGNTLDPRVLREYQSTPLGAAGHSGRRRRLLPPPMPGLEAARPPTGPTTLSMPGWRYAPAQARPRCLQPRRGPLLDSHRPAPSGLRPPSRLPHDWEVRLTETALELFYRIPMTAHNLKVQFAFNREAPPGGWPDTCTRS